MSARAGVRRAARRALVLALGALAGCADEAPAGRPEPPALLSQTGLYRDPARLEVDPANLAYEPQYPLWTDGARKQRWIRLPEGGSIDASDPDHWRFPAGTRFWKEFAFERRIETRAMELAPDGTWVFAAYLWRADGSDAELAPERGVRGACESAPGVPYDVPGRSDCTMCHEAGPSAVLGFSALQLSPDRDPLAPHAAPPPPGAVDLPELARRGLLRGLPSALLASPPRIAAATARERAVLGYLHGNCGACHTGEGALASLGLVLDHPVAVPDAAPAIATALGRASRFTRPGASLRLAPGDPGASVLVQRLAARDALVQMPPLGTHLVDRTALALVEAWVREELAPAAAPDGAISRSHVTE